MFGYVYETTNLVNGKKYIGRCKSEIFLGEKYLGSGLILNEAISKYGKENFKVRLVDTAESDSELNSKEEYYIDLYDAVSNPEYYNLRRGGLRGPGRKMSEDRKGSQNSNYGNRWTQSEELKQRHRELSSGTNNPMYGRHHSEESKLKNRLSNQDKKWINNGLVNKTCKINEVESYLKDGWKLGMLPRKKHKV